MDNLIFFTSCLLTFKDPASNKLINKTIKIKKSFYEIITTFKEIKKYRNI